MKLLPLKASAKNAERKRRLHLKVAIIDNLIVFPVFKFDAYVIYRWSANYMTR